MYHFFLGLAELISRLSGLDLRRLLRSSEILTVSQCSSDTGRMSSDAPISGNSRGKLFSTPCAAEGWNRRKADGKRGDGLETQVKNGFQLPLFPADSPASRSARPGSDAARMMTATSGRRCLESYALLHPDGSWQKTFLASCLSSPAWSSKLCLLIWNLRATRHFRWYVQLRARVPRTSGNEYLLLPTPKAEEHMDRNMRGNPTLTGVVKMRPTPTNSMMTAADLEQAKFAGNGGKRPSYQEAKMLPTPIACRGEFQVAIAPGGSLNPEWVEWLQGFPIGWTDYEPSGTA